MFVRLKFTHVKKLLFFYTTLYNVIFDLRATCFDLDSLIRDDRLLASVDLICAIYRNARIFEVMYPLKL